MSSKNSTNGIMVPWYGYLMLFLLYVTPFAFMTPIGLLSGLFTAQEMGLIFKNPIINIMIALVVIAGAFMTYHLRDIIVKAELTPEGIKKFNKKLILADMLDIIIPVSSMIIIGETITISLRNAGIKLAAFQGGGRQVGHMRTERPDGLTVVQSGKGPELRCPRQGRQQEYQKGKQSFHTFIH